MNRLRNIALASLSLFVVFFVVLAADVAWRLWSARAGFGSSADVALLLVLEAVRAAVTLSFVCVAVIASEREEAGHTAFAFALLFFALWYVKFVSFAGYPGFFQQWLALELIQSGVPLPVLRLVFGQPLWALAPAAAAFLHFGMRYPEPPRADLVRSVHATGRRGMMRGVALAGADVRSLLHHSAARALESGLLTPRSVAAMACVCSLMLAFGGPGLRTGAIALLIGAFVLGCVFLRTAWIAVDGVHRGRLQRLGLAGASLALELMVCGMLAFVPGGTLARVALALAAAAPLGALFFLIGFVRGGRKSERTAAPMNGVELSAASAA